MAVHAKNNFPNIRSVCGAVRYVLILFRDKFLRESDGDGHGDGDGDGVPARAGFKGMSKQQKEAVIEVTLYMILVTNLQSAYLKGGHMCSYPGAIRNTCRRIIIFCVNPRIGVLLSRLPHTSDRTIIEQNTTEQDMTVANTGVSVPF